MPTLRTGLHNPPCTLHQVILADCAGIRETEDPVEAEGVRRARATLSSAHIVVQLRDAQADPGPEGRGQAGDMCGGEAGDLINGLAPAVPDPTAQLTLWVRNKCDLMEAGGREARAPASTVTPNGTPPPAAPLLISCATGEGLDELITALGGAVEGVLAQGGDPEAAAIVTRARHAAALSRCIAALQRYEDVWTALELAAEELRAATRALGAISGVVDTEEVLDSVFSEFCIGK